MSRLITLLVPLGLSFFIAGPALGQVGGNRSADPELSAPEFDPPATVEECADVEQGVTRLACYDHFLDPDGVPDSGVDPGLLEAAESIGVDREELEATQKKKRNPSLVEQFLARQRALFSYSGAFVQHRANYLLPVSYVDPINNAPRSANFGREQLQEDFNNIEAKFQFSVRMPVLTGLFSERTNLWVAYTQLSFWQAYNSGESSPFRESNYEPEIFFSYQPGLSFGPASVDLVSLGFNHQSNGRSDPLSRSWNRIMANIVISNDRWILDLTPWYRIPESDGDDNNPDIHKYLGYGNYELTYKLPDDTTLGVMFRNNLDFDDNRSSFRLDYTFPLSESVSAYVQYYHGWGESLIDYNHHVKRIGVGITIANWR